MAGISARRAAPPSPTYFLAILILVADCRSPFRAPTEPLFPFGYGLSYTTFSYTNLRLAPPTIGSMGETKVSVDITNTGKLRGDEVVQLYIHDEVSSVTRPIKELRGFRRISLDPG